MIRELVAAIGAFVWGLMLHFLETRPEPWRVDS